MEKGNVVIWHVGRCGSTVLSSVLNQNPEIQSLKEFLNPIMRAKTKGEKIPDLKTTFNELRNYDLSKIQILEMKFLEAQHLSVYNLSLPELIKLFKEIGYDRFIVLERKNYLKRMVSHCVGQETNIYHLKKSEVPELHKIELDIDKIKVGLHTNTLLEWFSIIDNSYNSLKKQLMNSGYLELEFERDIKDDVTEAYKKVCSFLNIEPTEIEIPFARTNPFKISEMLTNFNEVEKLMIDNGFSWMLKE